MQNSHHVFFIKYFVELKWKHSPLSIRTLEIIHRWPMGVFPTMTLSTVLISWKQLNNKNLFFKSWTLSLWYMKAYHLTSWLTQTSATVHSALYYLMHLLSCLILWSSITLSLSSPSLSPFLLVLSFFHSPSVCVSVCIFMLCNREQCVAQPSAFLQVPGFRGMPS